MNDTLALTELVTGKNKKILHGQKLIKISEHVIKDKIGLIGDMGSKHHMSDAKIVKPVEKLKKTKADNAEIRKQLET